MFYPAESLKKGGRFYLCWVADSWPLRFATITHRQLWSQDIRKICDDLLEVMKNESGRPTQRFSLRLSSQLLRGLVRLYQRKVNVFLGDLCMINANVIKNANKKWNVVEVDLGEHVKQPLPRLDIREVIQEPLEDVQRTGDMIQASGNAVANIQDITLREPTEQATDLLLKPNDGFGEENEDQLLQQLQDRTMEQMLVQADVSRALSFGYVSHDRVDLSHDKSHAHATLTHVEHSLISDQDHTKKVSGTMRENHTSRSSSVLTPTSFKLPTTVEKSVAEFEKDIPDIPEIPLPELPIPLPEKTQEVHQEYRLEEPRYVPVEPPKEPELPEIELEELENAPQSRRRRLRNKLIIDKKIKINQHHFRARIENPLVELRCQDSYDDIICIRVPPDVYFHRPSQGGARIINNVGLELKRLFARNLGVMSTRPRAEREIEEVMQRSRQNVAILEKIDEEQEVLSTSKGLRVQLEPIPADVNVTAECVNVTEAPRVSIPELMELDITDMLTQKVETLSQPRKRIADEEAVANPKRQRSIGYVSFRESQLAKQKSSPTAAELEVDKENRDVNLPPLATQSASGVNAERIVSSMLQEAGLADIQVHASALEPEARTSQCAASRGRSGRGNHSETSETPLGSLDRTKVSLGDSEQTTDSIRFIRDQWGTEGTMLKILKALKSGLQAVTVKKLIAKGPIIPGHKHIIAARCFTSILKLKQYGFIKVCKDPDTLEIKDINLGPKLTSSQDQF